MQILLSMIFEACCFILDSRNASVVVITFIESQASRKRSTCSALETSVNHIRLSKFAKC